MKITVNNNCTDYHSYRAARVKSLFNAESGANFTLTADLPVEDMPWKIGVIVGPSGSGKTSTGRKVFGPDALWQPEWPHDRPIVDAIAPGGDFDAVTGALAAVGLGTVPTWLRPYPVLSNGEKFRADLARVISEAPAQVVIDEFTSVVDRQIARFGALAFQKAWRRTPGQAVLLSCHYDVLEWIEPDWVFDTATGEFTDTRGLLRRPRFELEIRQTDASYWPLFKPHYYLDLPMPINATYYVGLVDGEPVCHLAVATKNKGAGKGAFEGRATRLVTMPEWQGAGVGTRFLNAIAQMWLDGQNRWSNKTTTVFHTSHPALCAALRRDPKWRQISAELFGGNKGQSRTSQTASEMKKGRRGSDIVGKGGGYGGHMRAIQGFRYYGEQP